MSEAVAEDKANPLVIIGDRITRKPHLVAFMEHLRRENSQLDPEQQIQYAVCGDSTDVATALKRYLGQVKMVLLGPGLEGNAATIARMLASKAQIVIVVDNTVNPLGRDQTSIVKTEKNLLELGVIVVAGNKATESLFEPIIQDYVLSDMAPAANMEEMSPEERAAMIDKRLLAVDKFPSLPETQRKVTELDDMDPPKKWAEAIDPDLPTRTVILRILNSARYALRSRVETIDKAVVLASARTIREIVTACQMQQIFKSTAAKDIDQFWRHSLATGFFAKLFALPADPEIQNGQQKAEFNRYHFEEEQAKLLQETRIWEKFELNEKDDAFTSGLLHDVGKVTMTMCLEESLKLIQALISNEVAEAEKAGKPWAEPALAVEQLLMKDIDHQVIGGRLAEKWEMDPGQQLVIAHHHDIEDQSPDLLKLIAMADLAANCLFPYPATDEQHPFTVLFAKIKVAVDKRKGEAPTEVVLDVIGQDFFEELVDIMDRMEIPPPIWEIVDFKTFFHLCYCVGPAVKSATNAFLQQTGS